MCTPTPYWVRYRCVTHARYGRSVGTHMFRGTYLYLFCDLRSQLIWPGSYELIGVATFGGYGMGTHLAMEIHTLRFFNVVTFGVFKSSITCSILHGSRQIWGRLKALFELFQTTQNVSRTG